MFPDLVFYPLSLNATPIHPRWNCAFDSDHRYDQRASVQDSRFSGLYQQFRCASTASQLIFTESVKDAKGVALTSLDDIDELKNQKNSPLFLSDHFGVQSQIERRF